MQGLKAKTVSGVDWYVTVPGGKGTPVADLRRRGSLFAPHDKS